MSDQTTRTVQARVVAPLLLAASLWTATSCGSATDSEHVSVATVVVTATSAQLRVGQSEQLLLRLEDAEGNELTERRIDWSTTQPAIASVSATGLVQALAPGEARIVATSEGKTGSVVFGIIPAVATVSLQPVPPTILVGATVQLSAVVRDNVGSVLTGRVVSWASTNTAIATVSETGLLQAIAPGSVYVTASSEGRSGSVGLEVLVPVAQVTVQPEAAQLAAGTTIQLTGVARDAAGTPLPGRTVTWTSANTAIARVSSTGLVTAVAAGGPVGIFAASEGKADTASITVTPHPCQIEVPITVGDTVTGELRSDDCQLSDGSYIDFWRFTLSARTDVVIRMNSAAIDTWLYLLRNDTVIGYDDDSGPGLNSALRVTLESGTYVIGATSYSGGETGDYTVSLAVDPNAAACRQMSPLTVPDTVTGTITNTDCVTNGQFYSDRWRLELSRTRALDFKISSSTMAPFVLVTDTVGNWVAFNPNGGASPFNLLATLAAGKYDVWATTWWAEAVGDYELTVREDPCGTNSPIAFDQPVNGTLGTGDCQLNDGTLADPWRITIADSSGVPVRVDLASPDFDAYLVLTDWNGNVLATDDDAGPGSSARIETTLGVGEYFIWANSYAVGGVGTYTLTASRLQPAAVNLVIDGAYLVQSTQRYDGTVPLISGKTTTVRVFGRANFSNTNTPAVRVRFYDAGVLVDSVTIPAGLTSVRTTIDEGIRAASWNALVPAALVKPGFSYAVEIDPTSLVAESDETDNVWPHDAPSRAVEVRPVPPLNLTFVPVLQQVNGLLGAITSSSLPTFTDMTRRLYPLGVVNAAIRATYTTTLPALHPGDENGSWWSLLGELEAIRVAENPTHHYYGVVRVSYTSGIAGISMGIPARVAAGVDVISAVPSLTAHELGHNFGRRHSPCGGAGGPDPNYPYPNGQVGVYGYDHASSTVISRFAPDIMSYCNNQWISDYTFEGVRTYRDTSSSTPPAAQPVLLVWGTIVDGVPRIEPAFHLVTSPVLPSRPGPWRLELRDQAGAMILSHSFAPAEIHDGARPAAAFTFALPLNSVDAERVASITVNGPTGRAAIVQTVAARSELAAPTAAVISRTSAAVTVGWDVERYPMAMVRDAGTGQILSLIRGGQFTVPTGSAKVDVLWSDGVKTRKQVIAP